MKWISDTMMNKKRYQQGVLGTLPEGCPGVRKATWVTQLEVAWYSVKEAELGRCLQWGMVYWSSS
jgi:hypothetical protein